jgi:hypothetical protein
MQLERSGAVKKNKKKTVQPLIDEVMETQQPKDKGSTKKPPQNPPQPAELDQDPGGGFNPDHTFPQT